MEPQDILASEPVNPQAIATHINRLLNPKGITAQVEQSEHHLQVLLASAQPLNQQATVAFICRRVESFNIKPIATITIAACQPGQEVVAWSQEIQRFSPVFAVQPTPSTLPTDRPVTHPSDSPDPHFELASREPASSVDAAIVSATPEPSAELATLSSPSHAMEPATASPSPSGEPLPDWLQRPEAVILIIFASLFLLWDFYLDLVGEIDGDRPLSAQELSRRLGVTSSTISRRKERFNFSEWSQDLDPDGVAWIYQDGLFLPQSPLIDQLPMVE